MDLAGLLAFVASIAAGGFGAIVGVGGGLILVPLLSVGLGVPLHTAIATSLLGVICVSTTASASFLRRGLADRRLGLTLLGATALGGLIGGYVAGYLDARVLAALFGVVLVAVAIQMLRRGTADVAAAVGVSRSHTAPATWRRRHWCPYSPARCQGCSALAVAWSTYRP